MHYVQSVQRLKACRRAAIQQNTHTTQRSKLGAVRRVFAKNFRKQRFSRPREAVMDVGRYPDSNDCES